MRLRWHARYPLSPSPAKRLRGMPMLLLILLVVLTFNRDGSGFYQSERKTPPFRAGESSESVVVC